MNIASENGFAAVNEFMQTNFDGVYAADDITGQITAHAGSVQGIAAVNHMTGVKEPEAIKRSIEDEWNSATAAFS